ncbi:hypothetical protein H920_02158 [Fukomys damarensis]|uniref:Small integral membrane protein 19 n=3 Tax=Fukomys damarensis TaxID=885580 RepID=A0A091DW96_FUKDA|nr:hypothetical protein H920_02158 [Fukomys damarensis]
MRLAWRQIVEEKESNRKLHNGAEKKGSVTGVLERRYPKYDLEKVKLINLKRRPSPMAGSYKVMEDDGSIDYTVHEAWNEATNVYLIVILVSFALFMYAKRNKRRIMRIFSVPPTEETLSEPNFYDTMSKIRLRQQLEMYSISRKYDYQQPQSQADSVQLSLE